MVVRLAVVVAAVAVLAGSAGASTGPGGWTVTKWSGNTFSGVFTNTTKDPINGVSVGTALKEGNPITAFTINAITCQLYAAYGSAYCYVSLLIQPGAAVVFHGTSKNPLTPAGVVMCTSADKGMDNTCTNVPLASKQQTMTVTTGGSAIASKTEGFRAAAKLALNYVNIAVESEASATKELGGDLSIARRDLAHALNFLQGAAKKNFNSSLADTELHDAISADTHALDWLKSGKPGRVSQARTWLKSAAFHKESAVRILTGLAR